MFDNDTQLLVNIFQEYLNCRGSTMRVRSLIR